MAVTPPSPAGSGQGERPDTDRGRSDERLGLPLAATLIAISCAAGLAISGSLGRQRRRWRAGAISAMEDHTTVDDRTGAVRSVQAADLALPESALREIWTPAYLERLARTYWRFLARITLGLVHVHYTESERSVVLLLPAIKLITFAQPEYETAADRGLVRWRIERGLLVARRGGRSGRRDAGAAGGPGAGAHQRSEVGHLQIEVRRLPDASSGLARLHIEVEVANFYPAIAFALGRRLYNVTQSRIHVLITHAFLRSLARVPVAGGLPQLAESKVGRMASAGGAEGTEP